MYRLSISTVCLFIGLFGLGQFCAGQVEEITDESELIAILAGDSPKADKAMACKRLAIYGSSQAVPELAKLLVDEQLASWTRIALEAIPGQAADEALHTACNALQGNLLVGVINSIGVRRNAAAVGTLDSLLKDTNSDVACAAANALGKIGDEAATAALRGYLAECPDSVRSAVAEACILCAERCRSEGNAQLAVAIAEQVRGADVPLQRVVEATRSSILAQQLDGVPLLVDMLRSPEKKLFQVALQTAREVPSRGLASQLVAELSSFEVERAALVVEALADMPGSVELDTILQLATSPNSKEIRIAAIHALGRVGDATCVVPLLNVASEAEDLFAPVKAALVEIPDEALEREVVQQLNASSGGRDTELLVEVVGLRGIQATSELLKALNSPQPILRSAALEALGSTVTQDQLGLLIEQVVAPGHAEDASAALQALKTAAVRMPDREACAAELTRAMDNTPIATRVSLLEVLGFIGGKTALQTLAASGKHPEPQLKDVSSRLLGEWMTIDAAPVLLELAQTGPADKFQVRAMRGYIRIARQFVMNDEQRAEFCANALRAAKQRAEKRLVVEVLTRYPSKGTLQLAIQAAKDPAIAESARQAAFTIAGKLDNRDEAQAMLTQAGLTKP